MRTSLSKIDRFLIIALGLFVLYTIGRFGIDQIRPPGMLPNDYVIFHRASQRLIQHEAVYRPDDPSPFKYSPTFLAFFRYTLHFLPPNLGWMAWCAVSIFGFALATRWLWLHAIVWEALPRKAFLALLLAFGVFGWHGYIEHFSYGQADVLLYAGFIAAVAANSDVAAALFMSGLLITKPQGVILLAYFLIERRFRMLAILGAAVFALLLSPALVWGWSEQASLFRQWWECLASQDSRFLAGNLNQSFASALARLSGHREAASLLTGIMASLAGAGTVACAFFQYRFGGDLLAARRKTRLALIALLLYALVSPLSWRWFTFVWLPLGVVLGADAFRSWPRMKTPAILLGLFALNGVLLQAWVAHALGIPEVDRLSDIGLYALGNALLFATSLVLYREKT